MPIAYHWNSIITPSLRMGRGISMIAEPISLKVAEAVFGCAAISAFWLSVRGSSGTRMTDHNMVESDRTAPMVKTT